MGTGAGFAGETNFACRALVGGGAVSSPHAAQTRVSRNGAASRIFARAGTPVAAVWVDKGKKERGASAGAAAGAGRGSSANVAFGVAEKVRPLGCADTAVAQASAPSWTKEPVVQKGLRAGLAP